MTLKYIYNVCFLVFMVVFLWWHSTGQQEMLLHKQLDVGGYTLNLARLLCSSTGITGVDKPELVKTDAS